MPAQQAILDWRNGLVPVSARFDDPYFSLENGLAETRHVFLGGNDLPARFRDGFRIAELGFGTGLNVLATVQAWIDSGTRGRLHLTSFEAFPMAAADMARALAAFPALAALAAPLLEMIGQGATECCFPAGATLRLVIGDARQTLPAWEGQADAWYLDGFSPAKNPELWQPDLLEAVAAHTAAAGTVATYSAAGHVRRALAEAGFQVTRQPGYGRKRHMTRGVLA